MDPKLNPFEVVEKLARIEEGIKYLIDSQLAYNKKNEEIEKTANAANCRSIENEKDITNLKANISWLWKTAFGGVILAIVAFVMDRVLS